MTVLVLRKTPGGFRSIIKSIRKPEIFGSKNVWPWTGNVGWYLCMTQPMGIYLGHDTTARGYHLRTYHTNQNFWAQNNPQFLQEYVKRDIKRRKLLIMTGIMSNNTELNQGTLDGIKSEQIKLTS